MGVRALSASASPSAMASLMDFLVYSTSFCCFVTAGDFTDGGDAKPGDFRVDVWGLRQGAGDDAVSTDLIGAGDVVESTEREPRATDATPCPTCGLGVTDVPPSCASCRGKKRAHTRDATCKLCRCVCDTALACLDEGVVALDAGEGLMVAANAHDRCAAVALLTADAAADGDGTLPMRSRYHESAWLDSQGVGAAL